MTNSERIYEWRKRKALADIINNNPKIYNSWRSFRYTQKGKKIGNDPHWDTFENFYSDMHNTYQTNFRLIRLDKSKNFCKDNCIWANDEESSMLRENSTQLEYNGLIKTLREWSVKLNIQYTAIRNRYYKHPEYTIEEVLFGKQKKRNDKPVCDWKLNPDMIRSKASKMLSAYRFKDIKMKVSVCDISIEWFIDNIILKPCVYCGDTYRIGADRIDNDKGHIIGNIVPCCYDCNCARNRNFTYEEMFKIGKVIKNIKQERLINHGK